MARLGDLLVGMGLATEEQRAQAFVLHRRQGGRFGTALLEAGVPEAAVATALGTQHDVPPATGAELEEIRQEVLRLVPLRTAQRLGLVPFRREGRVLSIAMKDPFDLRSLDEISLITDLDVRAFVAVEARIDTALAKHYGARVEPRHVGAIRLSAHRKPAEAEAPGPPEQSTAPRKARPTTLRVVYPPPFMAVPGEAAAAWPPAAPARPAVARDRSDPWSSTETRAAAALARPQEAEILEERLPRLRARADPVGPASCDRGAARPRPGSAPSRRSRSGSPRPSATPGRTTTSSTPSSAQPAATSDGPRFSSSTETPWRAGAASPEPETDLREFRLPLSEASVFATLRDTEGFYVGTYMDLPSTVKVLKALGSDGLGTMAVVPVTLKGKTVLYLWGESESYTRPPSVPALKRLVAMLATGLEVVRLKSRLFTL